MARVTPPADSTPLAGAPLQAGPLAARAPGKVNLCLFLGPTRPEDGRHELVSVITSVSLADELRLEPAPSGAQGDEVVCAAVPGPNLAGDALAAYRERTGWNAPPVRLEIVKRVPIAAGMGGGSGDAAAALRLAAHAAGRPGDPVIEEIAPTLGADVPSQLAPGTTLVTGAGEHVRRLGLPEALALAIVPLPEELSTAAVYREADRLKLARSEGELADRLAAVERAVSASPPGAGGDRGASEPPPFTLPAELLVNDLEPAARSLCPPIERALAAVGEHAEHAMVSGSGPTVMGIFTGDDAPARATVAAHRLRDRYPDAVAVAPVGPDHGAVRDPGAR
jgi:4-diphosphocytidyl-2-C-methyl-D-erythritol kinase